MEAIVHQTLSNILLSDSTLLFVLTDIDNELVSNATELTSEEHFIADALQLIGHVVGVHNRLLGALKETLLTAHFDVRI